MVDDERKKWIASINEMLINADDNLIKMAWYVLDRNLNAEKNGGKDDVR